MKSNHHACMHGSIDAAPCSPPIYIINNIIYSSSMGIGSKRSRLSHVVSLVREDVELHHRAVVTVIDDIHVHCRRHMICSMQW